MPSCIPVFSHSMCGAVTPTRRPPRRNTVAKSRTWRLPLAERSGNRYAFGVTTLDVLREVGMTLPVGPTSTAPSAEVFSAWTRERGAGQLVRLHALGSQAHLPRHVDRRILRSPRGRSSLQEQRARLRILLLRGVAPVAANRTASHVTCDDATWCITVRHGDAPVRRLGVKRSRVRVPPARPQECRSVGLFVGLELCA